MPNATSPNRNVSGLVTRAQITLGMTHRQFGEALGASQRTAARWAAGQSSVSVHQLATIARMVHPTDPALAKELAESASETLESLGIVAPPAPRAPSPAASARVLVDVVVCAAADVMGVAPNVARPVLLAAFARAKELGLDVAALEAALRLPPPRGGRTDRPA